MFSIRCGCGQWLCASDQRTIIKKQKPKKRGEKYKQIQYHTLHTIQYRYTIQCCHVSKISKQQRQHSTVQCMYIVYYTVQPGHRCVRPAVSLLFSISIVLVWLYSVRCALQLCAPKLPYKNVNPYKTFVWDENFICIEWWCATAQRTTSNISCVVLCSLQCMLYTIMSYTEKHMYKFVLYGMMI